MGDTITLKKHQLDFVTEQIAHGRFSSAEEVVDEALRALQREEHLRPLTRGELIGEIEKGEESVRRGKTVPLKEGFQQIRQWTGVQRPDDEH